MQFKDAVTEFQNAGDRTVIGQILTHMYARTDSRAVLPGDSAAVYVALRAITVTYPERLALQYDPAELPEYKAAVYEALGVNIFGGTDLSEFRANAAQIRRFLGLDDYDALVTAVSRWMEYGKYERAVIIPALEHALTSADTQRSEREVVRYVNRVFETEYIRLLTAWNGTVRLGRRDADGRYQNVYVVPIAAEPWRILFERTITPEESSLIMRNLTVTQREYAEKAYEVIVADIESGQLGEYKVSEHGEYRIKIRYMAGRIGVEEGNLRKSFLKIRRKAAEIVPIIAY
ncbi:hypothetical protein D3C75_840430 [compost metagenome]